MYAGMFLDETAIIKNSRPRHPPIAHNNFLKWTPRTATHLSEVNKLRQQRLLIHRGRCSACKLLKVSLPLFGISHSQGIPII